MSRMTKENQRRDDGEFQAQYSDQDFLEVISQSPYDVDTSTVAEEIGASRRHTYDRLKQLEDQSKVVSQKVGNSLEWRLVDDRQDKISDAVDFISTNLSQEPPLGLDSSEGMVIAIRDPHSQAILDGEKNVEFRRSRIRQSDFPDIGFIYEPSPTQAIVGVFSIEGVESCSIDKLKDLAEDQATSTRDSIDEYFGEKEEGTAIFIDKAEPIEPAIPLHAGEDDDWAFTPPQNYYYVDPGEFMISLQNQNRESPSGESQQVGFPSSTS